MRSRLMPLCLASIFFLAFAQRSVAAVPDEALRTVFLGFQDEFATRMGTVAAAWPLPSDFSADPLNDEGFVADMFSALAYAVQAENSPRRNLLIWAGMASLSVRLDQFRQRLASRTLSYPIPQSIRELSDAVDAALLDLSKFLVFETGRLNPAYYAAKKAVFETLAERFAKGDWKLSANEYQILTFSFAESDRPLRFRFTTMANAIFEQGKRQGEGSHPGLKHLATLLLVPHCDQLSEGQRSEAAPLLSSCLHDFGFNASERAIAGYGLAQLSRVSDLDLMALNSLLTEMLAEGRGHAGYATLCRRALDEAVSARWLSASDPAVALGQMVGLLNQRGRELGYFLTVPKVQNFCLTRILNAAEGSGGSGSAQNITHGHDHPGAGDRQ